MFPTLLYGSVVGLSLGLTGGGGSIFAVPLLVYGLVLFAALMAVIGAQMLRRTNAMNADVPLSWIRCQSRADGHPHFSFACAGKLFGAGAVSGVLSGIFGVGGGFLVVPALLIVACVSIERALATSLVGISLIAASGFVANAAHLAPQLWILAGLFLAGSAIGMTIGVWAKTLVPARALNVVFGLSVLGVAAFVILRNLSHP